SYILNDTPPSDIYTLSLHDALPISRSKSSSGIRYSGPSSKIRCLKELHERESRAASFCAGPCSSPKRPRAAPSCPGTRTADFRRSEEHTSELQSRENLVCRLLLEKK